MPSGDETDRRGTTGRIVETPDVRKHRVHIPGRDAEPAEHLTEILVGREFRENAPAAADVVVTEKDAVKLRPERLAAQGTSARIWVAPLDFSADAAFDAALQAVLGHGAGPS